MSVRLDDLVLSDGDAETIKLNYMDWDILLFDRKRVKQKLKPIIFRC